MEASKIVNMPIIRKVSMTKPLVGMEQLTTSTLISINRTSNITNTIQINNSNRLNIGKSSEGIWQRN